MRLPWANLFAYVHSDERKVRMQKEDEKARVMRRGVSCERQQQENKNKQVIKVV
jgi:hypothetical protein